MISAKKMVMVIDDEADTAEMFAEMMLMSGYRVIKSSGGAQAIKMIAQENPDVLILDVMMPEVSGLEILRFLKNDPYLAKIPVVVVSAKALPSDIRFGLDAGASKYLTKPVSFQELKGVIDEVLKKDDSQ
ncbi:MAG: response regulator [Anaerolineales bacterium]|nr:response regulator [Anaerolineales bacterium]